MPRLCIVQPSLNVVSETFIRAHGERLPGVVGIVHTECGVPWIGGSPVLSQAWLNRLVRKAGRLSRGKDGTWEVTSAFVKALRTFQADIVLAEFGTMGIAVSEACEREGVPLVVHFHGFDAWRAATIQKARDSYRRVFGAAAAIVTGCRSMSQRLVDLGAPPDKVVTNYVSTVDERMFAEGACTNRQTQFVAVGRLVEKKAPHLTLIAFSRIAADCPDAVLHIIGDGPLRGVCEQLADGLAIAHRVKFLGACDQTTVRRELLSARGFVQHSICASDGDREGTAISVLEAAMSGVPVIATRHEGIAETVVEGETGLLVDERDVAGMAEHMLTLARNPLLAAEMGRKAAAHVRKYFTMDHSISRLARVLEAAARRENMSTVRAQIEAEFPARQVSSQPAAPTV